jgi:hypothetical protein
LATCQGFSFAILLQKVQNNIINKINKKMPNPESFPSNEEEVTFQLSEEEMKGHKYISDIGERAEIHTANVYNLVKEKLSNAVGVDIQEAPELNLVEGETAKFSTKNTTPEIVLGKNEFIRDMADTLGHEFGHFLRSKLTDKLSEGSDEYLTDEFFGFLSGRLFFEKLDPEQRQLLFPDGEPSLRSTYEGKSKSDIVKELKPLGKIKRALDKEYKLAEEQNDVGKINEISVRAKSEGVGEWFDTITHYRGYEFASKIDLSKITDWQKLYSMPDEEVRKRFFTPNPDYSGLEYSL